MEAANGVDAGVIIGIVRQFLKSKNSILFLAFALALGIGAILATPREEEPQIIVPMADIMVQVPGASAQEVEKLVATPLERLLWQIDGVEYVYSMSRRDACLATVRFHVGEDRENALVRLHNTIMKNQDLVPSVVTGWVVKPVEIDDVPIVTLTLYADAHTGYGPQALRRMGEEMFHRLAEVENVSRCTLTGGMPREVRVSLSPEALGAYHVSALDVRTALAGADASVTAGSMDSLNRTFTVTSDSFLRTTEEVRSLVVGAYQGRPVYLGDVAEVADTAQEPRDYVRIGFSDAYGKANGLPEVRDSLPAVTLGVSKKKGTNAVTVAEEVIATAEQLKATILPDGVHIRITRNYGATAQAKVDDLLSSLGFAIVTVVILLAFTLGRREALVVAVAVPVSFALALAVNWFAGYTINRVTLFALILSLGLVVDDPITNVDNIQRHIRAGKLPPMPATLRGVREVLPPVIMSTLAIIVCFTPMFFITGMMGPYMAPMAVNVPLTVTFSTVCALTVVPWLSYQLLKHRAGEVAEGEVTPAWIVNGYRRCVTPFLDSRTARLGLAGATALLFIFSLALAAGRFVPLKMLPFDNRNELQIVLDLPEGSSVEATDRAIRDMEAYLRTIPEITDFTTYAGTSSPMDFNGMVRHYYLRDSSHQADIRINLLDKSQRDMQSHALALSMRDALQAIADRHAARLKLVETPPGPPVLSTITAEVYGSPDRTPEQLITAARHIQDVMRAEPGVTDIDATYEARRQRLDFTVDREKAALHGISARAITDTLQMAVGGISPATLHLPDERQPLPIHMMLPRDQRSSAAMLEEIPLKSSSGHMVPLGELGSFRLVNEDQPIYHKNLKRVVYVFGEMAGRAPAEAVLDMSGILRDNPMPPSTTVEWAGEGEWKITLDVFRDLGIAFGVALLGIYLLLIIQTDSFGLPLLIMSAIPLTLIGIMPGFWLLNLLFGDSVGGYDDPVFFTATSMIGMIALGGIVIRNSLVLIEFIQEAMAQGMPLRDAVLQSGATRMRPILLTAATTALGAWPITLDPIFSGLAYALIFGLIASTLFTLLIIPVTYHQLTAAKQS
ncbi:efflux RND transporter permease subunit [Desulfovibrio mangrovi]|uniref:efflux RND transporter permease subunit n=1 Tax=Desulfovibrio mangrovi TaxID=2976983 RepID=UPI002246D4B9|nr:efflux RND transporter permease subunit [Desulfovibrio mangrovi]UZP69206.1 efflux RND transporter permease subunit [Desulfovibrio mangrovi]